MRTTLQDDVVVLSPPTLADVDDLTSACQDAEILEWTTVPAPYSREHAVGFVTHVVEPGWGTGRDLVWAIRREGRLMGVVGLHAIADGSGELGYWVAPWGRRQGLLGRAVALAADHALDPDGVDLIRLTWHAYVGNWPSMRVAWRAGFDLEGVSRLEGVHRDLRRDSWRGTLLRGDPREPRAPWPAEAPAELRAVVPAVRGVPVPQPRHPTGATPDSTRVPSRGEG